MVRPNKPMENKDSGGGHGIRRILRAIVALIVSAATLLTGASTALATQAAGLPGYWYNPASDGSGWFTAWHGTSLGVVTYDGDNPIYCIEAGIEYTGQGTWEQATDRDSKIAAFMVDQHKNDRSDMTQAAIAYAIHAHLDRGQSHFNQLNAVGLEGADINAVAQLANQLWNEASLNMPDNIQASYQYTQGKRKGTINPGIKNVNGQWVAGVPYTVTDLNDVVNFDATGTNTYSGVTSGQEEHIPWTAKKNGTMHLRVEYQGLNAVKMNSPAQDLFKKSDPSTQSGEIEFEVVKDFQPTVSTQVSNKTLDAGETITDKVTSGVAQGDSWVDDTTVKAKGYYFTGDDDTILRAIGQNGTVENPEDPADYLKRVKAELGEPVATAETEFNAQNIIQGRCDSPVTKYGLDQAHAAGRALRKRGVHFGDFWCSPSGRAKTTLETVMLELGIFGDAVHYQCDEGLLEASCGNLEGKSRAYSRSTQGGGDDYYALHGGENIAKAGVRCGKALARIMEKTDASQTLVVGHNIAMRKFLVTVENPHNVEVSAAGNCETFVLTYRNGTFTLEDRIPFA